MKNYIFAKNKILCDLMNQLQTELDVLDKCTRPLPILQYRYFSRCQYQANITTLRMMYVPTSCVENQYLKISLGNIL